MIDAPKPSPCPGGCRCAVCLSPPIGAVVSFSPCALLSRRAGRAVVCRPAFTSAAGARAWRLRPVAAPRRRGADVPSVSARGTPPGGRGGVSRRARARLAAGEHPAVRRGWSASGRQWGQGDWSPCGGRGGEAPCPVHARVSERGRYSARVRPVPGSACVLRSARSATGPRRGKRRQRARRRSRSGRRRREDTARAGRAESVNV